MIKHIVFALFLGMAVLAPLQPATAQQVASWIKTPKDNRQPLKISMARMPVTADGEKNAFVIRLSTEYNTTGCAKFGKIPYTMEFQMKKLKIDAGEPAGIDAMRKSRDKKPCPNRSFYPSAEIPLSPAILKENGTTLVEFGTPGNVNGYDIKVTDHSVELTPSKESPSTGTRYAPRNIDYLKNPMKLWFYPEGTVILKAGSDSDSADIAGEIQKLAGSKGLVPLESELPGFTSPLEDEDSFYYVDKSGMVAKDPNIAESVSLGSINVPSTIYGAEGPQQSSHSVQVFAHAPGDYE